MSAVIDKAARFVHDGRVTAAGTATVYTVRGLHDTYRVILGDDWQTCNCPATLPGCSHTYAAMLAHHEGQLGGSVA